MTEILQDVVQKLAMNLRFDIENIMSKNFESSIKPLKKSPKKSPTKSKKTSLGETSVRSPSKSPSKSTLGEALISPALSKKRKKTFVKKELELENDGHLQNYDLKYWPLLSILDTDFLSEIEMILLYGWSDNPMKFDAALIVKKDKNVYVVGNKNDQFGISGINSTLQPEKVEVLCQKNIKTMIGSSEPCLFVLTEEGKVYSWGNNKNGKLGHDVMVDGCEVMDTIISYPLEVTKLADKRVVDIKCGNFHVLVLTDDRKIYSWGKNIYEQDDDTEYDYLNMIHTLTEVIIEDELGKKDIQSISCGSTFSMAITCDGTLYGWGENTYGQLGLGNSSVTIYPKPIKIMLDVVIAKVECGLTHTLALTREGLLYIWGQNDHGQLGNGTYVNVCYPIAMDTRKIGKVTDIATRFDCKKSAAINKNKRIYIWGAYAYHDILSPIIVNLNNIQDAFMTGINVLHKLSLVKVEKQSNVIKCLETAFNNSASADVEFIVDHQSVHIHRTIIMLRCPEMYRIVFANNTDNVITRNDFSAASYKAFLKYLYTDIIDIPYEKELELFNLVIFYHDKFLAKYCIRMIKKRITISNVIHFYAKAILLELKELEELCFKYAINNLTAVVKTEGYAELSEKIRFDFIIKAADAKAFKH